MTFLSVVTTVMRIQRTGHAERAECEQRAERAGCAERAECAE